MAHTCFFLFQDEQDTANEAEFFSDPSIWNVEANQFLNNFVKVQPIKCYK